MILTEKEARDKWCPQLVHNVGFDNGDPVCCEASKCMAWRWFDEALIYPADSHQVCVRENAANIKEECPIDQRRGYCGLASRPER